MRDFRIYFAILPSKSITNCIAPGYRYVTGANTPEGKAKRKEAQKKYIDNLNKRKQFYTKLEKSILKDGILNPVLVQAGCCKELYQKYLPEEHQRDLTKALCCDRLGGSRLWVAQKHNMAVPCIISDFVGRFIESGFEELHNEEDIRSKLFTRSQRVIINDHGVYVREVRHLHLEPEAYWRHLLEKRKNGSS